MGVKTSHFGGEGTGESLDVADGVVSDSRLEIEGVGESIGGCGVVKVDIKWVINRTCNPKKPNKNANCLLNLTISPLN